MKHQIVTLIGFAGLCSAALTLAAQTPPPEKVEKVDVVSVIGCLKQQAPDNWMLVSATDPAPSIANAPQKKEIPEAPVLGRNQFKLIGISEYDLPAYKDNTVLVKALYIKATPVSRLNLTSITRLANSCAAAPTK